MILLVLFIFGDMVKWIKCFDFGFLNLVIVFCLDWVF